MKDRIYNSTPVDCTARKVTGEQPNDEIYYDINYGDTYMSLQRPPTLPYYGFRSNDLTGTKIGKLTVIGVFIKQNPKKKLKWLVQCLCGYYTTMNSNVIKRNVKHKISQQCFKCHREDPTNKFFIENRNKT